MELKSVLQLSKELSTKFVTPTSQFALLPNTELESCGHQAHTVGANLLLGPSSLPMTKIWIAMGSSERDIPQPLLFRDFWGVKCTLLFSERVIASHILIQPRSFKARLEKEFARAARESRIELFESDAPPVAVTRQQSFDLMDLAQEQGM